MANNFPSMDEMSEDEKDAQRKAQQAHWLNCPQAEKIGENTWLIRKATREELEQTWGTVKGEE